MRGEPLCRPREAGERAIRVRRILLPSLVTRAAPLAVRILATTRPDLRKKLKDYQHEQARKVREETLS
jgi:phosphoribosylcarboxyaminoimidazole (NCAIR) mutase